MTIKTRNIFLLSLLIITAIPIFLYIISSAFLISETNSSMFEFIYPELATRPLRFIIFSTGILLLYSIITSVTTFFYFRRTASTEMFFFLCFLATINFEALKPLSAFLIAANKSDFYILIISKLSYYGYLLGSALLLIGAYFSKGIDSKRSELILVLVTVTILYIVLKIPFYTMMDFSNNFTFNPYLKIELYIGSILAVLSGTIIYFYSGIQQSDKDMIFAGLGYFLLVLAREVIHQLPQFNSEYLITAFIILLIPLIAGTILFVKKTHNIYLWG